MKKITDLYNSCAKGWKDFKAATNAFIQSVPPASTYRKIYNSAAGQRLRDIYNTSAMKAVRLAGRGIKNYLWPFRVWKAIKAQKYVIPVLIAHQLIQTPTVLLFPKAEDYLKDHGVSADVAKKLSDRDIRVRERNFLGTLHSYNDLPTVIGMMQGAATLMEPAQAYAHPDLATRLLGQCPVTMPAKDVTARHALAALANLNDTETADIENIPMTDEQARMAIAFHEFSHCDTHNNQVDPAEYDGDRMKALQAIPNHAEDDADARGLPMAGRVFKNPEIPVAFLYARALNKYVGAHDTSLYLDAVLHGQKPPRELDAMQATADVFAQLSIYQRLHEPQEPVIKLVDQDGNVTPIKPETNTKIDEAIALEHLVKEHPDMFNDLSRRRAELFIDAVKYFYPTKYAQAHAKAPPVTHVYNMVPTLNLTQ